MVRQKEECTEFGGYFILNGIEKLVRMLIVNKRNYPIAFLRPGYVSRGAGFTEYAVQIKCVRADLYAKTVTLHYVNDGSVYLRLLIRKQEFLIPVIVILKALHAASDLYILSKIMKSRKHIYFWTYF